MPHIHFHEVFTACAHSRFFDTVTLPMADCPSSTSFSDSNDYYNNKYDSSSAVSSPSSPSSSPSPSPSSSSSSSLLLRDSVEHEAIFRFGWCPDCLSHISSSKCRQGRPSILSRDAAVLRAYWRYKAVNQMDSPVPAREIPYSAYIPSISSRRGVPSYAQASFGASVLLWEERALYAAVRELKPGKVRLGPLVFRLPMMEDALRNMLRGARQWTILWAKGDEALYKKDPGLDLNKPWLPSDERAWEIERYYQPYRPLPPEREHLRRGF